MGEGDITFYRQYSVLTSWRRLHAVARTEYCPTCRDISTRPGGRHDEKPPSSHSRRMLGWRRKLEFGPGLGCQNMAGKGRQQKRSFHGAMAENCNGCRAFKPSSAAAQPRRDERPRWALRPTQNTHHTDRSLQCPCHSVHFQETAKVYSLYWDRHRPHVSQRGSGRGHKDDAGT